MRVGLVLEGGAMRGLYSAGVLDTLMTANIQVNDIVAVSAGALFGVNYVSKQPGRAMRYNQRFLHDKRYMSLRSWLTTGNLVNKEFAYYDVPFKLDVFDDKTFQQSDTHFYVTVTNVTTGQAEYIHIDSVLEQMEVFRATSALPIIAKMVPLNGQPYLDGGITDSIPVRFAQSLGVDKLIILLTQPIDYRKPANRSRLHRIIYRRYPKLVQAIDQRPTHYNDTVDYIRTLEQQGDAFVIRPSRTIPVKRFEKNLATLSELYQLGCADAQQQLPNLQQYLTT